MKWQKECYDCALRQGHRTLELAQGETGNGAIAPRRVEAMEAEMRRQLDAASPGLSPAALSRIPLLLAADAAGCGDPYRGLKHRTNAHALEWYPELSERLRHDPDPLRTGALLAVAGNIIDLGIHRDYDLAATLDRVLGGGFTIDHFEHFRRALEPFQERDGLLFYIGDNSGEIVFDRLFIEVLRRELPRLRVVFGVKGSPILNDATLEDARTAGMTDVCEVVTNGNGYIGTELDKCSPEFLGLYHSADLIVAKGQGNYETLEDQPGPIYMVLQAKCETIAAHLGVNLWDAAFLTRQA